MTHDRLVVGIRSERDKQTDRQTHRFGLVYIKLEQVFTRAAQAMHG